MSNLRWFGLMVGILGFILTFRFYRGVKWHRGNFLLLSAFNIGLVLVSINPNVLNFFSDMLALKEVQRGRLLALLVVSNIFLLFYSFNNKSILDRMRWQIDQIFRKLGTPQAAQLASIRKRICPVMVVIPALNESDNLRELLPRIPAVIGGMAVGVLVIDDGSSDDTRSVVEDAGHLVVSNAVNRGGGAALRLGYDLLENSPCEICVTMDADCQHDPEDIQKLLEPIQDNQLDFVIGSRILGNREPDSAVRYIGVRVFGKIISILLGHTITDPSSGFRAFQTDVMRRVKLVEDQYHTSELIIQAVRSGIRIGEVPIYISKRKHGRSKKGRDLVYGLNFARIIAKTWWR